MKFDIIIGNPPYIKGLHHKILEKSYSLLSETGSLFFIHPSTKWLRPPKKLTQLYSDIVSLDFRNGVNLFNVAIWVPISLSLITKNSNNKIFSLIVNNIEYKTDIQNVSIHGNRDEYISLKSKIKKANNTFADNITKDKNFKYYFKFGVFGGHAQQKDQYFMTAVAETNIKTEYTDKCTHNFGFNTIEEAENCQNYLRTKFAMRCLSLVKINQHIEKIELQSIPYLDFTQSWPNEKIYEYFNLNQKEIDFINELPEHPLEVK